MKNSILTLVILVTGFVSAQKANLNVNIVGLKNNNGVVMVGLYNSEGTFLKKSFKSSKSTIKDKKALVTFTELEKGEYAVMIYQDENFNGKWIQI